MEAIAKGDVKEAQAASEYHMEQAEHTLLASMEELKKKAAAKSGKQQ